MADRGRVEVPRSREQLAAVVRAISEPVVAVDLAGFPLFYNAPFIQAFGGPEFESREISISEVFRTPEILEGFSRAFRGTAGDPIGQWLHTRLLPGRRYYSVSITSLHDSAGRVFGAVGVYHDLTALKKTEELRMDFLANVSHELKTPLTAIKGYADTLYGDLAAGRTDGQMRFMEAIVRNVDRLMKLIKDVLELSVLQAGEASEEGSSGQNMKLEMLPVREVTNRVLTHLELKRARRNHSISVHSDTESVFADGNRLEQVLSNLLENAFKYVPDGGKIEVRWTRVHRSEGGVVELRVRDNGPGIAPQHQERLFERFYRADEGRSREEGGSGLGLAIVKHIVQNHGGSVRVESRPGEGATFICEFPDQAARFPRLS